MDVKVENGGIEENKRLGWGKSLPVPSVQEIVRNDPHLVPERYIREEKKRPLVFDVLHATTEIPVVDFSLLAKGDEAERMKLDLACKEWGFFQIKNHGVEKKVLQNMKAAMIAFFDLPLEEKKKCEIRANDVQGYGQLFVASLEQKLDWNDMMFLVTHPPENRNFKIWPLSLPGFKEAVEMYSKEVESVAEEIFANISALMGMERDCLSNLQGTLGIRLNYYPPCSRPDVVVGISPHADKTLLSFILQDDEISGLQIKHKGEWVAVKPIPGCFLVNIGDCTQILSNGVYKSIEHRVITNEKRPRMSVAAFAYPDNQMELRPLESMVDDLNRPRMYKNIKFIDYISYGFARKMEGKAHIDLVKLESKVIPP